jgi:hypothetical protein
MLSEAALRAVNFESLRVRLTDWTWETGERVSGTLSKKMVIWS